MTAAISPTISAAPPAWTASDWNALRAAGLAYVEKYSRALWTDYNRHDPGITLLELLCYALTDLSQRASLPTQDILRSSYGSDEALNAAFPRADQVLPGSPITLLDYRKILLDVPGVRNVWLVPNTEYRVLVNSSTGQLSKNAIGHFTIGGIYDIKVDVDPAMISLLKEVFIDRATNETFQKLRTGVLVDSSLPVAAASQTEGAGPGSGGATPAPAVDTALEKLAVGEKNTVKFNTIKIGKGKRVPVTEFPLPEVPTTTTDPVLLAEQQAVAEVLGWVRQAYLNHRNLAEDCGTVVRLQTQPVAIVADIELLPDADLTTVHASLLLAFDQYLAPVIKRHSLAEMQALTDTDGQPLGLDRIFEGPLLNRGFIRDEDLADTEPRSVVYASDLIVVTMAIPGVKTVRSLTVGGGTKVNISANMRPQLDLSIPTSGTPNTQLNFYQDTRLLSSAATRQLAVTRFDALRAQYLLDHERSVAQVPVPQGTDYDLASYRPLALDLPATYGLAPNTLPRNATLTRRNQARQLQAYLLFFDQLLTNYLAQLVHVKDLLGTTTTTPVTYFGQLLDSQQLPGLTDLYEAGLTPEQVAQASSGAAEGARKDQFMDHLLARFAESFAEYGLQLYAADSPRADPDRALVKSRLAADQLLFAPAQGFQYHLQSWMYEPDPVSPPRAGNKWVDWSASTAPATTVTNDRVARNNVAGIVRRFGRLTGMADFTARNQPVDLSQNPDAGIIINASPVYFALEDISRKRAGAGTDIARPIYLFSEGYNTQANARTAALAAQVRARERAAWKVKYLTASYTSVAGVVLPKNSYALQLLTAQGIMIGHYPTSFDTAAEAEAYLTQLLNQLNTGLESIFVVEHMLLRPVAVGTAAIPDGAWLRRGALAQAPCQPLDPYTYRVTIVLPKYTPRFADVAYRAYAEQILRGELPAHILAHICWVDDMAKMRAFEGKYQAWAKSKRENLDAQTLATTQQALVDFLQQLQQQYLSTEFPGGVLVQRDFNDAFSLDFS